MGLRKAPTPVPIGQEKPQPPPAPSSKIDLPVLCRTKEGVVMDFETNLELREQAVSDLSKKYDISLATVDMRFPTYLRMAAWDAFVTGNFRASVQQAARWYQEHGAI